MRISHAIFTGFSAIAAVSTIGLGAGRPAKPSALLTRDEPARIEVRRPREDLILTRDQGGPWIVARQPDLADSEAVELLLSSLRTIEFGPALGPADSAPASGLGPADSIRLRVLDSANKELFDGYFGRRVFSHSAYFRVGEQDAVRWASGLDPELLRRPSAQWREARVLPGGCQSGLELFARGAWRRVADDAARELCALRASRWAADTSEDLIGFERPMFKARTSDGRSFTVGERRGAERLVRVDGRAALLRIPAQIIEAAAADLIGSKP